MSTASGQSIDQALEQVAEYFAEGKLNSVEALLPEIIANGDDIQRQMGIIYREQLDLLRAEADGFPTEVEEILLTEDEEKQDTSSTIEWTKVKDNKDTVLSPQTTIINTKDVSDQEKSSHCVLHEDDQPNLSDGSFSSQFIDQRLEKIAELLTDGQMDMVEAMLPTILKNGNDTQKQMAEAYYQQLSMLRLIDAEVQIDSTDEQTASTPILPYKTTTTYNIPEYNQISSLEAEDIVSFEENDDTLQHKKCSLGEAVFERAVSLIGTDNTEALKLLNRIVEADYLTQQQQALKLLAQLKEIETDDISESVVASDGHCQNVSSITSKNEIPPPQLISDTSHTINNAPSPKINTTNTVPENIGQYVKQIVQPDQNTPYTQSSKKATTKQISVTEPVDSNKAILQDSTDGLQRPSEVLQATYHPDALPTWDVDISILQHEQAKNYRQGFFVGNTALMIDFADGSELMDMPTTYSVPNAPPWLIGLTNVHSIIIPVFDLARFFSFSKSNKQKQMMLVLGHGDSAIGIIISGIPTRIQWQDSQTVDLNTAPMGLRKCIHAAYLLNNQLWFDLDCAALTTELKAAMQVH